MIFVIKSKTNLNSNLLLLSFEGIWSSQNRSEECLHEELSKKLSSEPIIPLWTPKSAPQSPTPDRKSFKPVRFESPTLPRKKPPTKVNYFWFFFAYCN